MTWRDFTEALHSAVAVILKAWRSASLYMRPRAGGTHEIRKVYDEDVNKAISPGGMLRT